MRQGRTWSLAFLLLLLSAPQASAKRRKHKKEAVTHRRNCEATCVDNGDDVENPRENCILQCTSPACYEEIYGAEELELGEIDNKRARAFTACQQRRAREAVAARRTGGAPHPTRVEDDDGKPEDSEEEEPSESADEPRAEL